MIRWSTWVVVAAVAFVGGCGPKEEIVNDADRADTAMAPVVVASNYPLAYMAERIGGDAVDVRFPARGTGDPSFWKPQPEDIAAMQEADLILLNGATYEQWLTGVTLPMARVIDTSAGFHDRLIETDDAITHSHGDEGAHSHSGTAYTTWLDFNVASEQARAVAESFAERWPEHAETFRANVKPLVEDLNALDKAIAEAVAVNPEMPVLFSHPVYQYFQRRYGVNGVSLHWEPDEVPDDAQWAYLDELLTTHPARVVIWEGEPVQESVDTLQERGIASITFDPCGNAPDTGDFLDAMKANVEALTQAYAG